MSITLLFPPPFDVSQPYLSLPSLSGFLRRNGIEVVQRDLNIEFYDEILSPEYLLACQAILQLKLSENATQKKLKEFCHRDILILPKLIEEIDSIKDRIRSPHAVADEQMYSRDIRYLHRACQVVSSRYYPSQLSLNTFFMRYKTSSISDMLEAVEGAEENPFIDFMRGGIAESIIASEPKLIGLSIVYTHQLIPALTIAKECKRLTDIPIVVGGEVISRLARTETAEIKRLFPLFDYVVLDDGSEPLLQIYKSITSKTKLESAEYVICKDNTSSTAPILLTDLNKLGRPDFEGLKLHSYLTPDVILPVLSGKGCEWGHCVFCTESFTKSFSTRNLSDLLDDLEYWVNTYGLKHINFADSDIPPSRLEAIADGLLARKLKISWTCYARLTSKMTTEIIAKISESGCRQIYFGLETASQRLLNKMRKGILVKRVPELLQCCFNHAIYAHLFCFVGFPSETKDEAWQTAKFLEENIDFIGSFNIGAFSFRTFSDIYKNAEKYGLKKVQHHHLDGDIDSWNYTVDEGLTMEESEQLSRELILYLSGKMRERGLTHTTSLESGYVLKGNVPAWQSHAVVYLTNYLMSSPKGLAGLVCSNDISKVSYDALARNAIIIESTSNSQTVFCIESGRLLRINKEFSFSQP